MITVVFVADDTQKAKLCDILFFATGSKDIPARGFDNPLSLDFLHDKYCSRETLRMQSLLD